MIVEISLALIGPYILQARDDGRDCLNFLPAHLSPLSEDVLLSMRLHIWFQHDDAPQHYSCEECQWLSESYPGGWIGREREAPVFWPARSHDLSSLDFFS
jgi:hypothetical protein